MKRLEFFKKALNAKAFAVRKWLIAAFSVINEGPKSYEQDPYPYRIVQLPTGNYFIDPENNRELTLIEDAVIGQPIFRFLEDIEATPQMCINLKEPVMTKIGNVLFNQVCIVSCFGDRVPFQLGKVDIEKIENFIAPILQDAPLIGNEIDTTTPRDPKFIYTDENNNFGDAINYYAGISQLCVYSFTEKNIVAPPGFEQFNEQLLKKYEGKLNDPVELTNYEKETMDYAKAYLKDDPSFGVFMGGKVLDISYRKRMLGLGAGEGFVESLEVTPIHNSLKKGWSLDPKEYTAMMNDLRVGSYSRGIETVNGGVAAKNFLRATGNTLVVKEDCGSVVGLPWMYLESQAKELVGRSVRQSNDWVVIESEKQALSYTNKQVFVRSPGTCLSVGDTYCQYCVGMNIADNPEGVSMAFAEISNIILTASLKAMHGKVLSTQRYDIYKDMS